MSQIKLHFIALLFYFPQAAFAYNIYWDCSQNGEITMSWENPTVNFKVRASQFNTTLYDAIKNAADEYDKVIGSNLDINTTRTNNSGFYFGNGTPTTSANEVYKVWIDWAGADAFAKYSYAIGRNNDCSGINSDGHFVEGDVWVNPTLSLTADNSIFSGGVSGVHVGRLAMHEFGHLAGHIGRNQTSTGADSGQDYTSHEGDLVTTMNSGGGQYGSILGANGSLGDYRNRLHADDAAYLRLLYPDNTQTYDVSGSRWRDNLQDPADPTDTNGIVENSIVHTSYYSNAGTSVLQRGQGYFMPYTIQNQSTATVDVQVDVWMTQDGKLDGVGDLELTNSGAPLFHLYTMNSDGHVPGTLVNTSNSSTIENKIYFVIPNDVTSAPNGFWRVGFRVSMPYLPAGASDDEPLDNWVSLRSLHFVEN